MPIVIVNNLNDDAVSLCQQFTGALDSIGLSLDFDRSRAIFIKPNLTYPNFKAGVTTRKIFVAALVAELRNINTTTKIYIGEGEGGYNSFSMTDAMNDMGFYEIAETYPNVEIVNLSRLATRTVELKANGKPYLLNLPELFFQRNRFFHHLSPPESSLHDGNHPFVQESMGLSAGYDASKKPLRV